jgi:hypothetical protein
MSIPRVLDAVRADGPTLRKEARGSLPVAIRHFRYPMANDAHRVPDTAEKDRRFKKRRSPFPARI